jgi:phospholipid transport system substrate-binding protein
MQSANCHQAHENNTGGFLMIKRMLPALLVAVLMTSAAYASVTEEVKKTVDDVIRIVADKELRKPHNEQKRRAALKRSISNIFDYQEMAKRSLGKHWAQRTPTERKQFVDLFATLLENSYGSKIESYNNEKVVYIKETVDGEYAEVKSKVVTAKHDEYTLDYKLLQQNNKWVVYDVVIEGVSLVSNYRTQFNKIISANGYNELVKKLQTKSNEVKMQ